MRGGHERLTHPHADTAATLPFPHPLPSSLLTGTFFWVATTALSAPRMEMLVRAPDFAALKAYSVAERLCAKYERCTDRVCWGKVANHPNWTSDGKFTHELGALHCRTVTSPISSTTQQLTNLIQSTLGTEDGDVPVETCPTAPRHG